MCVCVIEYFRCVVTMILQNVTNGISSEDSLYEFDYGDYYGDDYDGEYSYFYDDDDGSGSGGKFYITFVYNSAD